MVYRHEIEELKARGAGHPAPDPVVALYREAFDRRPAPARSSAARSDCGSTRPARRGDAQPVAIEDGAALASAGRREPRDVLDLPHIHEHHLPLGAVVWAAVGKDPGLSPECLIAEVRRNARYRADLALSRSVDAGAISRSLKAAREDAEGVIARMPSGREGLAYLERGRVVRPGPDRLVAYEAISGRRRGHWPSSPDIAGAMIERNVGS